jgi:hypothetical protein
MDHNKSNEFSLGDNTIYIVSEMQDLPQLLEEIGYDSRDISTQYMCYEHYKQIFHFALVKFYNVKTIFTSRQIDKGYNTYNSIMLDNKTDPDIIFKFLYDLFELVKEKDDPICIFCDIQSIKYENSYHTTLLIFRPKLKQLEHFDSNGIANYGHIEKLYQVVNSLKSVIFELKFIESKEINGLIKYSDGEAYARGLNVVCGISMNKSFAGWCQIWSLMVYELVFKYPNKNTIEIISDIYKYLKGIKFREASIKAINIIKGFYRILLGRVNFMISPFDLSISNKILTEWYPLYIISDKKLSTIIETEMHPRNILDLNEYF